MMLRYLYISLLLVTCTAGTLRAATKPHAVPAPAINEVWSNEDLRRLNRIPGLISIVGQPEGETLQAVEIHGPAKETRNPEWYAAKAAALNATLDTEKASLRDFTLALQDVRDGKNTTGGINLLEDNVGITPEATIEILQNRILQTQRELDALEDLARRNGIEPEILRSQS